MCRLKLFELVPFASHIQVTCLDDAFCDTDAIDRVLVLDLSIEVWMLEEVKVCSRSHVYEDISTYLFNYLNKSQRKVHIRRVVLIPCHNILEYTIFNNDH